MPSQGRGEASAKSLSEDRGIFPGLRQDELNDKPVFRSLLGKEEPASQPIPSCNCEWKDEGPLNPCNGIQRVSGGWSSIIAPGRRQDGKDARTENLHPHLHREQ